MAGSCTGRISRAAAQDHAEPAWLCGGLTQGEVRLPLSTTSMGSLTRNSCKLLIKKLNHKELL